MSSKDCYYTYVYAEYGLNRQGRAMVLIVLSQLEKELSEVRTICLSRALSERFSLSGNHGLQPYAAIYRFLQREGLVVLLRDPKYRRVRLIGLTPKGRDFIAQEL